MKVEGSVAIVTGGASGMGKGFAETLLQAGANVCIADFNEEAGQVTLEELKSKYGDGRVIFSKCNVTSQEDFEATFRVTKETFGSINIVVNNAGLGGESDDNWERTVDVNVKGTLRGTRLGLRYLSNDHGGNGGIIINMASAAGLNPNPFSPVYGCTKAGVIHATRCYAISEDAVKSGIRLNVLCPAFVDTPMLRNLMAGDASQTSGSGDEKAEQEKVKAFIQYVGIMTIEDVCKIFLDMLADDTKNGAIMKCGKNTGNSYCTIKIDNCD